MFGHPVICLDVPCMFVCPICLYTHMFGQTPICVDPQYVWTPHMFRCLPYVWRPPCLDAPICLDTPGHPHMFGCFICLDTPMFGHPPVCLDDKACFLCIVCSTGDITLLLGYLVLYIVLNLLQLTSRSLITCLMILSLYIYD